MTAVATDMVAQTKTPLLGQFDLSYVRQAAARTLAVRRTADRLRRRHTPAELQLLAACDAIAEVIQPDPVGHLVLREIAGLPTAHQVRLAEDNAA